VALRYVAWLARAAGVDRAFPPVLSLPLGAVDVSLLEIATLYQTMMDGTTPRFPGTAWEEGSVPGLRSARALEATPEPWAIIEEIRDREGNLLYRADRQLLPVVDPTPGRMVADILANVVQFGTGQRASGALEVNGVPWPLLGKTGTTNEYRNAAFVGFVPVARGGRPSLEGGFTVAAYVGYDDNTPMKRGSQRVAGASGALPAWILAVRGMAEGGLLEVEGPASQTGDPVATGDLVRVVVDGGTGLPTGAPAPVPTPDGPAAIVPQVLTLPEGRERIFEPFRFPPDAAPVLPAAPVPVAPEPAVEEEDIPEEFAPEVPPPDPEAPSDGMG
jgi:membrane peptidoglycan carboxypeptidase